MKNNKIYGVLFGILILCLTVEDVFACRDGVGPNSYHAFDNFLFNRPDRAWLSIGPDHANPHLDPFLMNHSLFGFQRINTSGQIVVLPVAGISGTAGVIESPLGFSSITKRGGEDNCFNPAGASFFEEIGVGVNFTIQAGGEVNYVRGTGPVGSNVVPIAYPVIPRFPDIRPRFFGVDDWPTEWFSNPASEFEAGPGGFRWPDTTRNLSVPAGQITQLQPGVHYFEMIAFGATEDNRPATLDIMVGPKNTRTIIYLKGTFPNRASANQWNGRDAIRQGTGPAIIRTVDTLGNPIPFTCTAEHGEVLIISLGCLNFTNGGVISIQANIITAGLLTLSAGVTFQGQAIADRITINSAYDAAASITFRAAKTFALSVPAATFGEHPNWAWRTSGCEHDSDPRYYPSVIHGVGQGTSLEERPVIPGGFYDTSIVVALPANEQVEDGHIDVEWRILYQQGIIEPMSVGGTNARVFVEGILNDGHITGTFKFIPPPEGIAVDTHYIKLRIVEGDDWRPDLTFELDFKVLPTTSEDNKLNPFPTTITVKSDRGCSEVEICIPVDNISDVPTQKMVGEPLTLTGIVEPDNANYKTIEWSVLNAGGTGAEIINGNSLTTTNDGTLTVLATIKNGKCENDDFTQQFQIIVHRQAIATVVNFVVEEAVYLSGSNPADGLIDAIRIRFSLNSDHAFEVSEEQIRELIGVNAERFTLDTSRGFTVNSADISVNSNSGLITINVSQSASAQTYTDSNDVISISHQILPDSAMVIRANVSRFNIADGVAPIITEALYIFGNVSCEVAERDRDTTPDTLRIVFSERMQRNITTPKIKTVRGYIFDLLLDDVIWENDSIVKFPVGHDNSFRYQTDDSVFLSENSGMADIRGNAQNFKTQPIILWAQYNQPDYTLRAYPNPWYFDRSRGDSMTVLLSSCSRNVDMSASSARITVFDRLGNAVSNTEDFRYDEEKRGLVWTWSGKNRRGRDVAAGAYKAIVRIPGHPDMSIMLGVARGRARE